MTTSWVPVYYKKDDCYEWIKGELNISGLTHVVTDNNEKPPFGAGDGLISVLVIDGINPPKSLRERIQELFPEIINKRVS